MFTVHSCTVNTAKAVPVDTYDETQVAGTAGFEIATWEKLALAPAVTLCWAGAIDILQTCARILPRTCARVASFIKGLTPQLSAQASGLPWAEPSTVRAALPNTAQEQPRHPAQIRSATPLALPLQRRQ